MMWGYGWAWPMVLWMGIGALFLLAVLGLIVWVIARLLGNRGTFSQPGPLAAPSAQEILRQRYARGEIDATTYEQMRERLGG